MNKEKKQKNSTFCLICGKKSKDSICETCQNKIQAEAFYKKKKEEKPEK